MTKNIFLSLIAAPLLLVGCDGNDPSDTMPCQGSECLNEDGTYDNTLQIDLPYGLVVNMVRLAGIDLECTDASSCLFDEVRDFSGELRAESDEHWLVDIPIEIVDGLVTIGDPDDPDTYTCDLTAGNCAYTAWTGEGQCGIKFDMLCTGFEDGEAFVYQERLFSVVENGAIYFDGLPGAGVILTNTTFSGEANGDTFEGGIDGTTVHFQQFTPEGEIWKDLVYECQ